MYRPAARSVLLALAALAAPSAIAQDHPGTAAPLAVAVDRMKNLPWLGFLMKLGSLAGLTSVMLVMLLGQSRVFYTMATDGLLPKVFCALHPKFRTPYKSNMILFVFVGLFAAFVPGSVAGDLTSIGTLFAFVLVSAGVWIMRRNDPARPRPFKTPLVPFVPIMGMLVCTAMIVSLDSETLLTALVWMILGLLIYFGYSKNNSKLRA